MRGRQHAVAHQEQAGGGGLAHLAARGQQDRAVIAIRLGLQGGQPRGVVIRARLDARRHRVIRQPCPGRDLRGQAGGEFRAAFAGQRGGDPADGAGRRHHPQPLDLYLQAQIGVVIRRVQPDHLQHRRPQHVPRRRIGEAQHLHPVGQSVQMFFQPEDREGTGRRMAIGAQPLEHRDAEGDAERQRVDARILERNRVAVVDDGARLPHGSCLSLEARRLWARARPATSRARWESQGERWTRSQDFRTASARASSRA